MFSQIFLIQLHQLHGKLPALNIDRLSVRLHKREPCKIIRQNARQGFGYCMFQHISQFDGLQDLSLLIKKIERTYTAPRGIRRRIGYIDRKLFFPL